MAISRSFLGWCAIVAGVVGLIGFVFLLLFFALEAPKIRQEKGDRRPLFGILNDASSGFVALLMVPVALGLHQLTKSPGPAWSLVETAIGVAGLLAMAVIQAVYVARSITTGQQATAINVAFGAIGLWLVSTSYVGRGLVYLSPAAAWLGMFTGVSMVLLPLIFFAGGLSAILDNPPALLKSVPFMMFFVLSTFAVDIGLPVWAILLGRRALAVPAMGEMPPFITALALVPIAAVLGWIGLR